MRRRVGLLIGMLCGVMFLAANATAQKVSVFTRVSPSFADKYGIQVLGSGGTYLMEDLNEYRATSNHTGNSEDVQGGIGWGFSLLYRNNEHFRWSIGYSHLGQDRTQGSWTQGGSPGEIEQTVVGGEYYLMGSYLVLVGEALSLDLGAGLALYTANVDRSASAGGSFYDAHGRAVGFRAGAGLEWKLTKRYAVHVLGGFRQAKIDKLLYEDINNTTQTVTWGADNRRFTADFTGVFFEAGLRLYFSPGTHWFKL